MILPPKKLDSKWMLQAVQSGYFGVWLGNWGKPEARQYLRTCNINTKTAESILEKALADKSEGVVDPESVEPHFWKQIDCFSKHNFPLLPLHGLCHGMIPDVMSINHQIFKKYRKIESFCKFAKPILEDIASLGLSYLKVKQLPKAAWIGEMSRIMPYLYGLYLMNNPLCGPNSESSSLEEVKITVKFMLCLLNSFQCLTAIYMGMSIPSEEVINDHIKLFMSSAHYLHKQHGQLDTSERDAMPANGNGKGCRTSKKKFFESQNGPLLKSMLSEVDGMKVECNLGTLRNHFNSITVSQLQKKLEALTGEKVTENSKDQLHHLLYEVVIPDEDKPSGAEDANAGSKKKEKMCWNRGNWLSFMAEIARQILYLGPRRLIW